MHRAGRGRTSISLRCFSRAASLPFSTDTAEGVSLDTPTALLRESLFGRVEYEIKRVSCADLGGTLLRTSSLAFSRWHESFCLLPSPPALQSPSSPLFLK